MVKKRLEKKNEKKTKFDSKFWMMTFIALIFIFSMVGFALNMAPTQNSNNNNEKRFERIFDDYGNPVYIVIDGENYFSFSKDYRDNFSLEIKEKANTILDNQNINIYFGNYSSSKLILKKTLDYKKIFYQELNEPICDTNNLILSQDKIEGDCLNIYSNSTSQIYSQVEELIFHIVMN